MSQLIADCPRCKSQKTAFDLMESHVLYLKHGWQEWHEAFCVCRHCKRSTVFVLSQINRPDLRIVHERGLVDLKPSANAYMEVESYVSQKDEARISPPEFLPDEIKSVFEEGAQCLAIGCSNAAGTMFRMCLDIATRSILPKEEIQGLNSKMRRDLGLRLPWLFENGHLPTALKELATCIKEDGNDGAHTGSLTMAEAEDLLDFTTVLLERMYTEPKRLELAKLRRETRRGQS